MVRRDILFTLCGGKFWIFFAWGAGGVTWCRCTCLVTKFIFGQFQSSSSNLSVNKRHRNSQCCDFSLRVALRASLWNEWTISRVLSFTLKCLWGAKMDGKNDAVNGVKLSDWQCRTHPACYCPWENLKRFWSSALAENRVHLKKGLLCQDPKWTPSFTASFHEILVWVSKLPTMRSSRQPKPSCLLKGQGEPPLNSTNCTLFKTVTVDALQTTFILVKCFF